MRRSSTTRSGSPGKARASRHSVTASVDDPAAAPDQAVRFVVAAPHEPVVGRADAVAAVSAEQAGEHCVVVPGGRAQERDVAAGSYQGAAFAVGDQRVLAQHVGGGSDEVAGRASGHGATIRA